ncbi:MAG: helix-turn-helix domain-containing protein [Acidimicrobiia bacterium]|nr:helix-turn-helix domain-containing protein [Acidimicrobiia bacterium]MYB74414.1 helix-turn-helix domain-containing protein [Acidimicrobiia bacterium]MYI00182.1 helix-turn-helix domain-containing protein [Acidimicrobiia bacterium]
MDNPPIQYVSQAEAASILGISARTFRRRRDERADFPKPRDFGGGIKRWRISDLEEWAEAQSVTSGG